MHIALDEAILLLDSWRATGTALKVYLSRAGRRQELAGKVTGVRGSVVDVDANGEKIAVDLTAAEFNGDRRSALNGGQGPYLVCEYRNGDRCSFYAPRDPRPETGIPSAD
jgi:hypothetical protein